jgi:hypothetical protein
MAKTSRKCGCGRKSFLSGT